MASAVAVRRHTIAFALVVGLHAILALGLVAGTVTRFGPAPREQLAVRLIRHEQPPPHAKPPPEPPPPEFKPPAVQSPSRYLPVIPSPPSEQAIVIAKAAPAPLSLLVAPRPITDARPAMGANLAVACAAYYPPDSRRLNEGGAVVLLVYVTSDGRVAQTKVETSTGVSRLDAAAEKCLKSKGRFEPQMARGEAVGSWQRTKWTWHANP